MDAAFEAELRGRFPREFKFWEAIAPSLRESERSFTQFMEWFFECPSGAELRAKRDGKRPPFHLSHFEWVEASRPRRIDAILRAATGESAEKALIDDLRAENAALRAQLAAPSQAPPREVWCIMLAPTGAYVIERHDEVPLTDARLIEFHTTREGAESALARITGRKAPHNTED